MPRKDLESHVWQRLSARKHFVGRRICDRLTRRTIRAWDHDVPRLTRIEDQVFSEARQEMGLGIIAAWLLSALLSEIVRLVWEWFTSSEANRGLLYVYQGEMATDEC